MATYRITWFFEGYQASVGFGENMNVGWTESWYLDEPGNLDAALRVACRPRGDNWIPKRLAFLHPVYEISAVRAVDVDDPRKSKSVFLHDRGRLGNTENLDKGNASSPDFPAQVTCALLVDITRLPLQPTEPAHHKRLLLRGLPQGAINGNVLSSTGRFQNPITRFLDYVGRVNTVSLVTGGNAVPAPVPIWKLRYRDPAQAVYVPITSLANPAGSVFQLSVGASMGALTKGDRVNIIGVTSPRGANRVWTVQQTALLGPYLLGTAKRELQGEWSNTGQIAKLKYQYGPADQYNIIGMRVRHTGRPFARTRGRRPARRD